MPPSPQKPIGTDHLLPPHESRSVGPVVGTIIVVLLLIAGGLYFWGERLNRQSAVQNQVPYILNGTTTTTVKQ